MLRSHSGLSFSFCGLLLAVCLTPTGFLLSLAGWLAKNRRLEFRRAENEVLDNKPVDDDDENTKDRIK